MGEQELLSLGLILLLVMLSGFFSSAEAAFLSIERLRLAHLVSIGEPGARRVAEMLSQPARLLSTILLGNNLVNVAFTALATVLAINWLGQGRGVLAATVVGTAILLVLGEIVPKTLAVNYAKPIAFLYAGPLKAMELVCSPVIALLQWITRLFARHLGLESKESLSITEAELRTMLNIGEAEGTFKSDEVELFRRAIRFGRRQAQEIMTPRPDMVTVLKNATVADFLAVYSSCGHTRLPVQGDDDEVLGLISAKDVLMAMAAHTVNLDSSVAPLMREVRYVPETKPLAALFEEMRSAGSQMVILLNEHGAVAGLATLKQLAEEVVGAVGEEGEAPEEEYEPISEGSFRVEGGMNVFEANESMALNLPEGDYNTVAGFVLEVLGHIPMEGEEFSYGPLQIEVERMNDHKIESINVTIVRKPAAEVEAED
jgi:magnesium and cobalt exporter, CNNM family